MDREAKEKFLVQNPFMMQQYKDLVEVSKVIEDKDFWEMHAQECVQVATVHNVTKNTKKGMNLKEKSSLLMLTEEEAREFILRLYRV